VLFATLEVSSSAYYEWEAEQVSARELRDAELLKLIREIYSEQRGLYGAPRIFDALKKQGHAVSLKRVGRLMKEAGIQAKTSKKFKVTTDSNHAEPVALNYLARNFSASAPNRRWVSDITYIRTRQGWLYLAVIIDLYSRKVVGWALRDRMTTNLICNALEVAVRRRRPPKGLLFHSDRGSQYASREFRRLLARNGMVQSMSRKGNCWDNAVAESFFATLKKELVRDVNFVTKDRARLELFEYIESYYNRKRGHVAIDYASPEQFESCVKPREAA
jgi:transposase InsO family protein